MFKILSLKHFLLEQVQDIFAVLVPRLGGHQEEDVVLLQLRHPQESLRRGAQGGTVSSVTSSSYQVCYQVLQANGHDDIEMSEVERVLRATDRN